MAAPSLAWAAVEAAWPTLRLVPGGYTAAERGIVRLADGSTVFVKRSVGPTTQHWMRQEQRAYRWLNEQAYPYAPTLLATGHNGIALPDLSAADWRPVWSEAKLAAVLRAMEALRGLSAQARGVFEPFAEPSPWPAVPGDTASYAGLAITDAELAVIGRYLQAGSRRHQAEARSARHPSRGTDLVHLDVRSDNFCYLPDSGEGYLVDWTWLSLGSAVYDRTALLVSVAQRGYPVMRQHKDLLDADSLADLIGFWLARAATPATDARADSRRLHQLQAAVTAIGLYEQLLAD